LREIIVDTETTGLDPADGHRVVEIACLELVNCIPSGRVWHCFLDPERDMPQPAFDVHGLSVEVQDAWLVASDGSRGTTDVDTISVFMQYSGIFLVTGPTDRTPPRVSR